MSSNEVEKAQCLLKSFIDTRLSGNILNFTEYSLRCLIGDEKYGIPLKEDFSSMKILSAIGVVLQSDSPEVDRTTGLSYNAGGVQTFDYQHERFVL